MRDEDDDEKSKTLIFANPLGDAPPRPSPAYVSKAEYREAIIRLEAVEKTLEAHANRLTRVEQKFMSGQVETQAQFKTIVQGQAEAREQFKTLLAALKEMRAWVEMGPRK